jgi:hypothetical protein
MSKAQPEQDNGAGNNPPDLVPLPQAPAKPLRSIEGKIIQISAANGVCFVLTDQGNIYAQFGFEYWRPVPLYVSDRVFDFKGPRTF